MHAINEMHVIHINHVMWLINVSHITYLINILWTNAICEDCHSTILNTQQLNTKNSVASHTQMCNSVVKCLNTSLIQVPLIKDDVAPGDVSSIITSLYTVKPL